MSSLRQLIKNTIYSIGSLPIIKYITLPLQGRAAILCYHRIVKDEIFFGEKSPQKNLLVTIDNFDNHMNYLSKNHQVVLLDELIDHLNSESDEFKVAITFDDGYKDNLDNALPILKKYEIPATIYITTRFPEGDCKMWWYELWELIDNENEINIQWGKTNIKLETNNFSKKTRAYKYLSNLFGFENTPVQENFLNKLRKKNQPIDYKSICLSWGNIIELSQNPLITIGSHCHTHSSLKYLEDKDIYFELEYSKKLIEKKINQQIDHLAYPFGTENDVSTREHELAKKCGYKTAVQTTVNVLNNAEKLYSLPRLSVRNDNSAVIDAKLNGLDNFIYSFIK